MKAAFLIAEHQHPHAVARLVDSLRCDWGTTIIHVDAKVPIEPFRQAVGTDAVFLDQRISVNWGGWSQVRTAMALIAAASSLGEFDRFALLSGADARVAPLSVIAEQFASTKQFIRIDRELGTGTSQDRYITRWWDDDRHASRLVSGRLSRLGFRAFLPIYHGSQWWSLTGECVEYVRAFLRAHPEVPRFSRHTHCPEEWLFHTIIKRSPFADAISQDVTRGDEPPPDLHGCHYIDWPVIAPERRGERGYDPEDVDAGRMVGRGGSPRLLTMADFPLAERTGALFARKVQS